MAAAERRDRGERDDETAARREVEEKLRVTINAALRLLGDVRQAGGKTVIAFAAEMDVDVDTIVSGNAEIEWPRGIGHKLVIRKSTSRGRSLYRTQTHDAAMPALLAPVHMDKVAFLAASCHERAPLVTATSEKIDFAALAYVGDMGG